MYLYHCRLTFHENLFYATREIGRLYETGRYLHNYALSYALGFVRSPYFIQEQRPMYAEHLLPLNKRGIYVAPARGIQIEYALNTFKYANNNYRVKMEPGSKNTPSFGRAKEIAVGSKFEFVIVSTQEPLNLPKWVRMGLWRSKALLESEQVKVTKSGLSIGECSNPLNPLDLPTQPYSFDLISMPPASLLDHVALECEWLKGESKWGNIQIPANLAYRFK
jgi:CRISPR-associated protein Csc1